MVRVDGKSSVGDDKLYDAITGVMKFPQELGLVSTDFTKGIDSNMKYALNNVLDIKFFEGGLGDSIARLPAVRYILETYPHIKSVRLIAQDYFKPLAEFVFRGYPVKYVGYSELKEELSKRPSQVGTFTDVLQHTTLRTHLTHHAFNVIVNEVPIHPSCYNYIKLNTNLISSDVLVSAKEYAVITVGFTAKVREWLPSEINKVAQWFNLKGITPVFLGKSENKYARYELYLHTSTKPACVCVCIYIYTYTYIYIFMGAWM
jgi:hypothetical protein